MLERRIDARACSAATLKRLAAATGNGARDDGGGVRNDAVSGEE